MGRPPTTPTTRLGQLLRVRRGAKSGHQAAKDIDIDNGIYYRLETGERGPSALTARKLARWLGLSMEQVLDAADQPPGEAPPQPAVEPPAPPPPLDVSTLALQLPGGGTLQPWQPKGTAYHRPGVRPFAVLAEPMAAKCALKGLEYRDTEPGRSALERRDLLDKWLLEQGATPVHPPGEE